MANTYIEYEGDGGTDTFNVTFPYISRSHVKVYLDGEETTDFTWLDPGRVELGSAPGEGVIVRIARVTPSTAPLVTFTDGPRILARDLNNNAKQGIYVAAEASERLEEDAAAAVAAAVAAGFNIDDLADVVLSAIASGELLVWDGSRFVNQTLSEAGIAAASHTHSADDIVSGTFADARVAESNVTQHQAALVVSESQISDLGNYAVVGHSHSADDITSGTFDDARIAESNVTQHQAALVVSEAQISDLGAYIESLADDETPELGGNLSLGAFKIVSFLSDGIDDNATGLRVVVTDSALELGSNISPSSYAIYRRAADSGISIHGGNSATTGAFIALGGVSSQTWRIGVGTTDHLEWGGLLDGYIYANVNFKFESGLYIKERAAASTDITGYGQVWVDESSHDLYFTDKDGTDFVLMTSNNAASEAQIWAGSGGYAVFIGPTELVDAHAFTALSDGSTIAIDMAAGRNFRLTNMAGNRTLGNPTNEVPAIGQGGVIEIDTDGTERTLDIDTEWQADEAISWPITIAPNSMTALTYYIAAEGRHVITGISNNLVGS